MSDLGVLVPLLAPSGFSTSQSAAANTVANRDRSVASGLSSTSSSDSVSLIPASPLTGLASTNFAAALVSVLQETDDDPSEAPSEQSAEGEASDETTEDGDETADDATAASAGTGPGDLTPEEQRVVQELQRIDAEIRRHEQAHASVGGQYAGAPSYDYTRGPDGRLYAIGGDVQIDVAPIPGNPEATIQKMQVVRRAALAPSSPSPQDRRVAAIAQQRIIEAQREKVELEREERQASAEIREEAQQRAQGLQPNGSGDNPGGQSARDAVATIPALVAGATTVSAPVTTNGELLNVIA